MSLLSENSLISSLEKIEKVISHKVRFTQFLNGLHSLDRETNYNENVTSMVIEYLNLTERSFDSKLSSKSFKEKVRNILSKNFENILSLSVYENWIALNYIGDPYNHRFIIYSVICSKNLLADSLIRIFSMFQMNLNDRKIVDTIVKPSYYRTYKTERGYERAGVYGDFDENQVIESEYTFSHGRDLINNYSIKLELSADVYYKMKNAGFNFNKQISSSNGYYDLFTRFVDGSNTVDKDTIEFFDLYLTNSNLEVNNNWFSILSNKFRSLIYSGLDFEEMMNTSKLYDCLLISIAKLNPILYDMGRRNELLVFPLVMQNGFSIFRNRIKSYEAAFECMFVCLNNRDNLSKFRGLQLLEQIVKHINEDTEISKFLTFEKDKINTIGNVCFSFLCELKKYLIIYGKEKMLPFIDDVNLNCPGYALTKENHPFYYGPGSEYPIIQCDIFDRNTLFQETSYNYYSDDDYY